VTFAKLSGCAPGVSLISRLNRSPGATPWPSAMSLASWLWGSRCVTTTVRPFAQVPGPYASSVSPSTFTVVATAPFATRTMRAAPPPVR
jgi:hypothetical protein